MMPWTMNDYPDSLKNLDKIVRKKAIDIANAMIDEGYDESRAIPIATKQAKEWYKNANQSDIQTYKHKGEPTKRNSKNARYESRPELLDKGERIVPHENGWAVKVVDGKQPSDVFEKKADAVERGKEIAKKKGTDLTIHRKDGTIQKQISYRA